MTFLGLKMIIFQGFEPLSKFHFQACSTLISSHFFCVKISGTFSAGSSSKRCVFWDIPIYIDFKRDGYQSVIITISSFLVDISLQLFNDPKSYPDSKMKCKVQSRILTSFINGLKDQQLSEAELFLHELMVSLAAIYDQKRPKMTKKWPKMTIFFRLVSGQSLPPWRYHFSKVSPTGDGDVKAAT